MDYVNKIIQGNCLDVIKQIPDGSVNCVITSPPYWQLRDYGWSGQWGLEPTYQEYLEHLWSLMDEIKRVLRDDGTAWINLGDSYNGSGGCHTEKHKNDTGFQGKLAPLKGGKGGKDIEVPNKCLLLIPHRFAIGCIDRGWIIRNDVIWAKRNGMPESVTDRFSKKHEYFFFMVKSEKYYFDLDGVRDRHLTTTPQVRDRNKEGYNAAGKGGNHFSVGVRDYLHPLGKNPGSVSDFWDIPTQPSSEKHYATFNTKLIDKPIIAGCPEGGIILDPFAGTATTLFRAYDLGRKYIGIEGKPEYVKIGQERVEQVQVQPKLF